MLNDKELVNALRGCASSSMSRCAECSLYADDMCKDTLMMQAADRIERSSVMVLRVKSMLPAADINAIKGDIRAQLETGVIVLPEYVEYISGDYVEVRRRENEL